MKNDMHNYRHEILPRAIAESAVESSIKTMTESVIKNVMRELVLSAPKKGFPGGITYQSSSQKSKNLRKYFNDWKNATFFN